MSTATLTNVTGVDSSTTLLSANSSRQKAYIWNNSTAILYVKLGGGTASATSCTYKMIADAQLELPAWFTWDVTGIWAAVNGAARITELS